ncbi:MAG: diguanylate cyclase, partial [Spiribacter salinus]
PVVTMSLGVATYDPNLDASVEVAATGGTSAPGQDPLQLVKRADTALYQAKRAGKNRVMADS